MTDLEFQIKEALQSCGYSIRQKKPGSIDYPGMYGKRVYTGQPELGTRHDFDPIAKP